MRVSSWNKGYIQTSICSYFLPFFSKAGKENLQRKLTFNVSDRVSSYVANKNSGSMVLGIQHVLKDGSKIQVRTISLIQWEEHVRSVVQEFFQIWFKYTTGKPTATAYIPQMLHRNSLVTGTLDKQCEGNSHLPDFPQQYMNFNSWQAGSQSSEEGISGLDQHYLASTHWLTASPLCHWQPPQPWVPLLLLIPLQ